MENPLKNYWGESQDLARSDCLGGTGEGSFFGLGGVLLGIFWGVMTFKEFLGKQTKGFHGGTDNRAEWDRRNVIGEDGDGMGFAFFGEIFLVMKSRGEVKTYLK